MVDILHRIGAKAPIGDMYAAVATPNGLSGWWTKDVTGESSVGGEIRFRFAHRGDLAGEFVMKVLELRPDALVRWEVVSGPPEWIGTTVRFDLHEQDEYTIVDFGHEGWREPLSS